MKFRHLLPILFLMVWNSTTIHAQFIYVNDDAAGANDGSSWENAYTSLQGALAAAEEGGEVWVAEGTYLPDGPGGSREASFVLDKNLKLYGGFAGTENSLEDRGDPAEFLTLLSGDLNGDDVESSFTANRGDNVMTVVTVNGNITSGTVIDGFVIKGGQANGSGDDSSPSRSGGGMFSTGTPLIKHCIFQHNFAVFRGGGAFFSSYENLKFENSRFENNKCDNLGAGLHIASTSSAQTEVSQCSFVDNSAIRGGGLDINDSNCKVANCTFQYNASPQHGGGLRYAAYGNNQFAEVTGCHFEGNYSSFGGGLFMEALGENNTLLVSGCQFMGNFASPLEDGWGQSGGGAHISNWPGRQNNSIVYENCQFLQNSSSSYGGGMGLSSGGNNASIELRNLVFVENTSKEVAGAMYIQSNYPGSSATILVDSCHFEQNTSDIAGALSLLAGRDASVAMEYAITNSLFQSNEATEGGALRLWSSVGSTADFLLENCTIDGNSASQRGGGILINPHSGGHHAAIKRTTLTNNQSADGGAIEAYLAMEGAPFPEGASCRIENSLITGNSSGNAAISMELFPALELVNSTVAGNDGGGVELAGQSGLTLQNTILYNPNGTEFADLFDDATVTSNGGNLIGDGSLNEWLNSRDKASADPLFDADHHLMQGSPAIDEGVAYEGMPELDLAGNQRVQGNGVDIGAYESSFVSGGREALAEAPLALAPNPAGAFLRVELPSTAQQPFHAQVMDAQGKLAAQAQLRNGGLLNVEGLPRGMYLVKASVDGVVYTGRFVKQ